MRSHTKFQASKRNAILIISLSLGLSAQAETPQFFSAPVPAPAAVTAVTPVPVVATPILTSKDWRLFDLGTACVAETVATVSGVNHHLEVRVDKSGASPLEVAIRSEVATTSAVGYKSALNAAKTKTLSFTKLPSSGTEEVFWNVPQDTEGLLSYLKREMKFEAQAYDVTGALPGADALIAFSLRGSSAALADLGKRCAAGIAVPTPVDMAFEKAFLTEAILTQIAALDFSRMTTLKSNTLRTGLAEARKAFLSAKVTQGEIETLNAKYLKEINELTGLRRNLDRLTQTEITRLETARTNALAAIAQANQDIQTLKPQITVKEADLVQANTAYEAAYGTIKTHLPEYNRLVATIRSSESTLSQEQSDLANVESRLRQARNDLSSLQSEASTLRPRVSSAQSEAQSARIELDRAQRDESNFDAQSEVRRRMQADSRISNLQREIQEAELRIRGQEQAADRVEQDRNRLNAELVNCRKTPGKDCGPIQHQLSDTNRRLQELRQGVQVLRDAKNRKQDEMERARRNIHDEVARIQTDLRRRVDETRRRSNTADDRLREIEARLRSIEQFDIPSRQSDVNRLSGDVHQAERDVANAENRLRQTRTDLANYRQATGFDALQADVDRKLATVNGLKTELAQIDREIKKREKLIVDNNATLAKVSTDMEKVVAQIKVKETRSLEVQKALEPYELAKADLVAKKGLADQAFTAAQTWFSAGL